MSNKFIVVLGSSAGGLDSLLKYFDSTPHDQATYIILRHVPYDQVSHLHSILQRHSRLQIVEVQNATPIQKDTVYMPPPSMYMTIRNDCLYLHKRSEIGIHPNCSVDFFLRSLAQSNCRHCVAIILSGTGSDGSTGVKMINEAGGLVIAQTPGTCEYPAMVNNAILSGAVDLVLDVAEMPSLVLRHIAVMLKNTNEVERLKSMGDVPED